ncbi:hypothetical protein CsSME_00009900 [Camellia sinensis var. sinensis]
MSMGHDVYYLYVQMDEQVWHVRPEFELVYDNSNGDLPIRIRCISVNSKLYMVGGQKEQKIIKADDDISSEVNYVPNLKSFVLNLDVHPSIHISEDFSPLVVSVNDKFYVMARRPIYNYDKTLERPIFEVFDLAAVNGGSWKELLSPPWTDLAQFKLGGDYMYHHFVWGHKIAFCTRVGFYIFDTDMKKWIFTPEKLSPFPIISYELQLVFNPPFARCEFQGFLTHLGDGDGGRRMCLLYAGFDHYCRWCERIADFRVSISCNDAGDRFPYAYLETLQHYDFGKFDNPARWIDFSFVMFLSTLSMESKTCEVA